MRAERLSLGRGGLGDLRFGEGDGVGDLRLGTGLGDLRFGEGEGLGDLLARLSFIIMCSLFALITSNPNFL
jgi:hypothetical protein